jgi:hypothetical protein
MHRNAEQPVQPCGLEEDREGLHCPVDSKPNASVRLQSNKRNSWRDFDDRTVTPENVVGISEDKFEGGRSASWHWVENLSIVQVSLAVRV